LQDALIVNPYDTGQLAEAIFHAIEMDPKERRERMRRMRRNVKDHNIYRWAANLIGAVSEIRLEMPEKVKFEVV
jgi:trehalose 6-phosphate synthase